MCVFFVFLINLFVSGEYLLLTGRDNDRGSFKVNLNGTIENLVVLDREEQEEYLVCVQVAKAPRRQKRSFDRTQMIRNKEVGYIVIKITDVNDNGPSFPFNRATAGEITLDLNLLCVLIGSLRMLAVICIFDFFFYRLD